MSLFQTGRKSLQLIVIALAFGGASWFAHLLAPPQPLITPPQIRSADFWGSKLPDLAGGQQALAKWLGSVAVVNFWAPWCPPCRKEIPGFIELQKKYGERGLQFIGIALDQEAAVRAYARQSGITYPILLPDTIEAARLGLAAGNVAGGLPYTLVFDRSGHAVAAITGAVSRARMEALVLPLL